jgi:hypothetical protein
MVVLADCARHHRADISKRNGHCCVAGDLMSQTASVPELSGNTVNVASRTGPANHPRSVVVSD